MLCFMDWGFCFSFSFSFFFFLLLPVVECDRLPAVANGKIYYETEPSKTQTARYVCDPGYTLRGDGKRTCSYAATPGGASQWSPNEPRCG